ncbi:MAG: aminoglycoside phosphotransferase family protein [Fibrobacteres bacterium]|nr:aminoglycoside phosphotransferase family protein [Fibrobacterota bacterium]
MNHPTLPEHLGLGPLLRSSQLASGANNDIVLLEFERRKAVLKQTRPNGTDRLQFESAVLANLEGEIGPSVLWHNLSEAIGEDNRLILEHIAGEHRFELDDLDAARLGTALRCIHGTDLAKLKSSLESPSWSTYFQDRLLNQYAKTKDVAPSGQVQEMKRCLDRIHALGSDIQQNLSDRDKTLVHTDIIPLNAIFQEDRCRIIDWELARLDFPEWDLCSAFKSFSMAPSAKEALLQSYGRSLDQDRLRFVSLLHYSNVALWRLCSFYLRGENQAIQAKFLRELEEEIEWINAALP